MKGWKVESVGIKQREPEEGDWSSSTGLGLPTVYMLHWINLGWLGENYREQLNNPIYPFPRGVK
jgi:hypothetical protein